MAFDEAAAVQERLDRLWESMTAEQRRDYDTREDEVNAILVSARPLIALHEACREREEQLVANMTKPWAWIALAVAGVAYGLDFKAVGWAIAVFPLWVLLGGPIEAYFVIGRAKRLHQQLEKQRCRWIDIGANSSSFDDYYYIVRESAKNEGVAREYERVWWARLREDLVQRATGGAS